MQDLSYPRPQLRRDHWVSLDGPWRFAFDNELACRVPEDVQEWPHVIEVPFAPECKRSGIADQGFHRAVWYQREFEVDPKLVADGRRLILHFGAVDYHARVWINDVPVAEHCGGHTPFSADITFALIGDGPQRVTVWAEDDPQDLEKPRGKQDWRLHPHSIWYPRTTGIWQTVWLESVPSTYMGDLLQRVHGRRLVRGPARFDPARLRPAHPRARHVRADRRRGAPSHEPLGPGHR
jgi:beta-galactosidase/beta-glucuronidase